jgi:hypothetical protein
MDTFTALFMINAISGLIVLFKKKWVAFRKVLEV